MTRFSLEEELPSKRRSKRIKFSENVILPEDYVDETLDIGPKTAEKYQMAISSASFLVWNGPMGKFEDEKYAAGSKTILDAICESDAWKIAGGGETVEFIDKYNMADKFDFISSGGGAMLEFLSGEKLPGIEALENNSYTQINEKFNKQFVRFVFAYLSFILT